MVQLAQRVGLLGLASLRVLSSQAAGSPPVGLASAVSAHCVGSCRQLLGPAVSCRFPLPCRFPLLLQDCGQLSVGQGVRLR